MARRRAIWPEPERTIGRVSPAAATPEPAWAYSNGLLAVSNSLASVRRDLDDIAQRGIAARMIDEELTKPIVRDEAGRIVFDIPDPSPFALRYAQQIRAAAVHRYANALLVDAEAELARLHAANRTDPAKFQAEANAYIETVARNAPPPVAAAFRERVAVRMAEHLRGVVTAAAQEQAKRALDDLRMLVERAARDVEDAVGRGVSPASAMGQAIERIDAAERDGLLDRPTADALRGLVTRVAPVKGTIAGLARKGDVVAILDIARNAAVGSGPFGELLEDERRAVGNYAAEVARAVQAERQARKAAQAEFVGRKLGELWRAFHLREDLPGLERKAAAMLAEVPAEFVGEVGAFIAQVRRELQREAASVGVPETAILDLLASRDDPTPSSVLAARATVELLRRKIETASPEETGPLREALNRARIALAQAEQTVARNIERGFIAAEQLAVEKPDDAGAMEALDRAEAYAASWMEAFPHLREEIEIRKRKARDAIGRARGEAAINAAASAAERVALAARSLDVAAVEAARDEFGEALASVIALAAELPPGYRRSLMERARTIETRVRAELAEAAGRGIATRAPDIADLDAVLASLSRFNELRAGVDRAVASGDVAAIEEATSALRAFAMEVAGSPIARQVDAVLERAGQARAKAAARAVDEASSALISASGRVRELAARGQAIDAETADAYWAAVRRAEEVARRYGDPGLIARVMAEREYAARLGEETARRQAMEELAGLHVARLMERYVSLGGDPQDPMIEAARKVGAERLAATLERLVAEREQRMVASIEERRLLAIAEAYGVEIPSGPTPDVRIAALRAAIEEARKKATRARAAIDRWLDDVAARLAKAERGDVTLGDDALSALREQLLAVAEEADRIEGFEEGRRATELARVVDDFRSGVRGRLPPARRQELATRLVEAFATLQDAATKGRALTTEETASLAVLAGEAAAAARRAGDHTLLAEAVRLQHELSVFEGGLLEAQTYERRAAALMAGLEAMGVRLSDTDRARLAVATPRQRVEYLDRLYREHHAFYELSGAIAGLIARFVDVETAVPAVGRLRSELEAALAEPQDEARVRRLQEVVRAAEQLAEAAQKPAGAVVAGAAYGLPASADAVRDDAVRWIAGKDAPSPADILAAIPPRADGDGVAMLATKIATMLRAGGPAAEVADAVIRIGLGSVDALETGRTHGLVAALQRIVADPAGLQALARRAATSVDAAIALVVAHSMDTYGPEVLSRYAAWQASGRPPLDEKLAKAADDRIAEMLVEAMPAGFFLGGSAIVGPDASAIVRGIIRGLAHVHGDLADPQAMAGVLARIGVSFTVDGKRIGFSTYSMPTSDLLPVPGRLELARGLGLGGEFRLVPHPVEQYAINPAPFGIAARIIGEGPFPDGMAWLRRTVEAATAFWLDALRSRQHAASFDWSRDFLFVDPFTRHAVFLPQEVSFGKTVKLSPVEERPGLYYVRVLTADGSWVVVERPTEQGWTPAIIDVAKLRERALSILREAVALTAEGRDPDDPAYRAQFDDLRARWREALMPPWIAGWPEVRHDLPYPWSTRVPPPKPGTPVP